MRFTFGLIVAILAGALASGPSLAQSLATLAKQQGCTAPPIVVEGTELYKCQTNGFMSYFSGPPSGAQSAVTPKRSSGASSPRTATPATFPRVDSATQHDRDDVRKRVLTEELATEVRLMVEAEVAMQAGSVPLPDESLTSPKYLDRQGKLKATIDNHNRNVQALNKEIQRLK